MHACIYKRESSRFMMIKIFIYVRIYVLYLRWFKLINFVSIILTDQNNCKVLSYTYSGR